MRFQFIGDACVSLVFGEEISLATSEKVLAAYQTLRQSRLREDLGLLDLVPSYCSLAVHLCPGRDPVAVREALGDFFASEREAASHAPTGQRFEIPVCYDGPDLERLARTHGLAIEEVIRIHSDTDYRIAMIGFRPHFPYLIGLDPRLETPRLKTPRTRVPAGSVGIGGAQTGIYPEDSPGGWNLIGGTEPKRLQQLRPGDVLRFTRVKP